MLLKRIAQVGTIAALLAMSGFLVTPTPAADQEPTPTGELQAVQTFTGRVVGVHAYLTHGMKDPADAKDENKGLLGFLAPDAPIALIVSESSLVQQLVPGRTSYLIVFDPADSKSKDAYGSVRQMVWKDVSISGRIYDQDGLRAIVIVGVHDLPSGVPTH